MTILRYMGPHDEVEFFAADGTIQSVARGQLTPELDPTYAQGLLAQGSSIDEDALSDEARPWIEHNTGDRKPTNMPPPPPPPPDQEG